MEIEVQRKFYLLFHLPCLCSDFQGYFTTKLLFFFASSILKAVCLAVFLHMPWILSYSINDLKI